MEKTNLDKALKFWYLGKLYGKMKTIPQVRLNAALLHHWTSCLTNWNKKMSAINEYQPKTAWNLCTKKMKNWNLNKKWNFERLANSYIWSLFRNGCVGVGNALRVTTKFDPYLQKKQNKIYTIWKFD